jgi:beta-glucosidase
MTMPGTDFSNNNVFWGPQLQSAVSNGQVQQSRLDDMVRRVLAAWYLTGQGAYLPGHSAICWVVGRIDFYLADCKVHSR